MRSYMWTAVLLAAALLVTGDAKTQQQPAAGGNPLDVVPEKMPFNTPYGPPISLEKAQTAVQAAVAEASKRGWPLNVAVVVQKGITILMTLDDVIASRGGIPLIEDGKLIGAIGCSGATGSQDEVVCSAGAATINR